MKKHALHIISGDLWGGKEAQMGMQLPALKKLGWEVEVLCFNDLETAKRYRQEGLKVTCISETLGLNTLLRGALTAARNFKPSVVSAHGQKEYLVAALIGFRMGVPTTITYHGSTEKRKGLQAVKSWFIDLLIKTIARTFARSIITVSEALSEELGFEGNWRADVVRNVTRITPCKPEKVKGKRILVVGRLVTVKRVDLAISALSVVKKKQGKNCPVLQIVGEGPLLEGLKQLAKTMGVEKEVEFLGFRSDVKDLMCQSSALLISSDSEGIPTVALEAVSCGLPVISTELEGIREVAGHCPSHPFRFVRRNSADALAKAVTELSDVKKEDYFAQAKAELEAEFLPAVAAAKMNSIYEQIFAELHLE